MKDHEAILRAAEDVVAILQRHRMDAVVIGAVALAAYQYVRQTEDLDLGINADLPALRTVAASLRESGYTVELREPDGADPLGGVIGLLQIVNFGDRFPAVIEDALRMSTLVVREGSSLKLVPIPQLIALKLYAGGYKSKADIVELLVRNPDLDLSEIRSVCQRYRLAGIDELIEEARRS